MSKISTGWFTIVAIVSVCSLLQSDIHARDTSDVGDKVSPLEALSPLVGQWLFADEFLEKNPSMTDFYARTYEWGTDQNTIRLFETKHKSDPDRIVFEALIMRHPSRRHIQLQGVNMVSELLFEGEYTVVDDSTFESVYTVHYPVGFDFQYLDPDLPGISRTFRTRLTLTDANTLVTQTYIRKSGTWHRWPDNASDFVMIRAQASN